MRVSRSFFIAACLLISASPAQLTAAGSAPTAAEPLESVVVMQVDGWIRINPEGGVAEFTTDTNLLPKLRRSLEQNVLNWRFAPVVIDGTPRQVRAKTRVVLAVNQVGDVYKVKVDNVIFPTESDTPTTAGDTSPAPIEGGRLTPPTWPTYLMGTNVSGRVLLTIRVGADGYPEQLVAAQTMLFDVKGKDAVLRKAIGQFERSALMAARHWHFRVSAERGRMSAEERTVSIPVDFQMEARPATELPGKWRTIVRIPKRKVDWLPETSHEQKIGVSDVAAGEVVSASQLLKLETDVVGMDVM